MAPKRSVRSLYQALHVSKERARKTLDLADGLGIRVLLSGDYSVGLAPYVNDQGAHEWMGLGHKVMMAPAN